MTRSFEIDEILNQPNVTAPGRLNLIFLFPEDAIHKTIRIAY
jgi:hypothetical protein